MKVVIIYNPKSGSALPVAELKQKFKAAGIEVAETLAVGANLEADLQKFIGQDVVIAGCGGDGTISHIASYLVGTNQQFAPLPGGTLNHFTKDLGVPQNLDEAIANLPQLTPRKVDVMRVNDRVVINNSSLGLYPSTLRMRDEMKQGNIGKWPAAILACLKAFWRYRTYTVTIGGETFRTPFVFVGNNDYHLEELVVGQRTRLDEGVLSVYAIVGASRLDLLQVFARAILGRVKSGEGIKIWKTKQLTITTKRPRIRISRDGEHEKMRSPLNYELVTGGLTVLGGRP